jgi:hypothetical protein
MQNEPRYHIVVQTIEEASVPDVAFILRYFLKCQLSSSDLTAMQLTGAKIVQHETITSFIKAINAKPAEYVEYLRLFSACKFMQKHKHAPRGTFIGSDLILKLTPDVADKFFELNFTEEMMRNLDPTLFSPLLGMKTGDLAKLKKDFIGLLQSLCADSFEELSS